MAVNYPTEKIDGENIPWIRKRPQEDNREFFKYSLTYADVNNYPGRVLEHLARKFYGDPKLWHLIYEVNPPMLSDNYQQGMELKIPITSSFREAPIITSTRQVQ